MVRFQTGRPLKLNIENMPSTVQTRMRVKKLIKQFEDVIRVISNGFEKIIHEEPDLGDSALRIEGYRLGKLQARKSIDSQIHLIEQMNTTMREILDKSDAVFDVEIRNFLKGPFYDIHGSSDRGLRLAVPIARSTVARYSRTVTGRCPFGITERENSPFDASMQPLYNQSVRLRNHMYVYSLDNLHSFAHSDEAAPVAERLRPATGPELSDAEVIMELGAGFFVFAPRLHALREDSQYKRVVDRAAKTQRKLFGTCCRDS
eukprot:gnl/Chilomastix_cuspidata/1443.p1 GENE.gnl/Chilomastix_cuspidata/1443~~gnl/Chilomastix_cuspidata/1443.p1  ORF type:complete len:260 (-),score=62.39 gnl/Chilomastix_cuspidata/1443:36-815(-)